MVARYFELTRTAQLREVFGKMIERMTQEKRIKVKLDAGERSSLVHFHKGLRITYLNYQIISQIYYDAIIKTTYLFYLLSKIDPRHEILQSAEDKRLLHELLEFIPNNPRVVRRGWLTRNIPLLGQVIRTAVLQALLLDRGSHQGIRLHVHEPDPDHPAAAGPDRL